MQQVAWCWITACYTGGTGGSIGQLGGVGKRCVFSSVSARAGRTCMGWVVLVAQAAVVLCPVME